MVRSIQDVGMFPIYGQKFQSPKGDSTFTITHGSTTFVVDTAGHVMYPLGEPLVYEHSDPMRGNQSQYTATVKDFLTVDISLDSPGSRPF